METSNRILPCSRLTKWERQSEQNFKEMKDFIFRNDTKLFFRNDIKETIAEICRGDKVMFVYGSSSALKNGCRDDVVEALTEAQIPFVEFHGSSREFGKIQEGIRVAKRNKVTMIIGAGGASVMDSAKLMALGFYHESKLWKYLKGESPYYMSRLSLTLIPTYPSSGSENGLGAVAVDSRTGDYGTAYGIPADYAILCPKYSLTLDREMTAYTGLVTLVQLAASVIGDRNPMSYDAGISYIRNVLKATKALRKNPDDLDARGIILMGAALSTSFRLGIGKEGNYAYDIYELEFLPEILFGSTYRRSLTTIFPRFLNAMGRHHGDDIREFYRDAFCFNGTIEDSSEKLVRMFEDLGVEMYFDGSFTETQVLEIPCETELSEEEILALLASVTRKE